MITMYLLDSLILTALYIFFPVTENSEESLFEFSERADEIVENSARRQNFGPTKIISKRILNPYHCFCQHFCSM